MLDEYFNIQCRYQAAIRQVQTKLEILNLEFETKHRRNPIHHMENRMKTLQSITEKLHRKKMEVSMASAVENLYDIAGVRVVCSYIQDVFEVAKLLSEQDDISVIRVNDYIHHPKVNGYRSLHLVIEVPVFLAEGRTLVPVEVQIRTIAMDFWASLEHNLRYKADGIVPHDISDELRKTADDISAIDERMQSIHDRMAKLDLKTPRQLSLFDET
ncbi:MAG: GTP pyrophosphokinase family protein [Clostridiales bacterium]|nr:GTP pyrophosphokinase family protein [Clostridiales bacterium]